MVQACGESSSGFFTVLWRLACLVLRIWSVMMSSPSLVYLSRPLSGLLLMLRLARSQTVMMKFQSRVSHTKLLWFRVMVMLRFISRSSVSRLSSFTSGSPPIVRPQLAPQAGPNALSGMVDTNLLILLFHVPLFTLALPPRLVAMADAFLGLVNIDLVLLDPLRSDLVCP
jgi:hypothetical protein